jgi:hypothetical protein
MRYSGEKGNISMKLYVLYLYDNDACAYNQEVGIFDSLEKLYKAVKSIEKELNIDLSDENEYRIDAISLNYNYITMRMELC